MWSKVRQGTKQAFTAVVARIWVFVPRKWVDIEKNDPPMGAVTWMGLSDSVQRDTSQMPEAAGIGPLLWEMSRVGKSSKAECRLAVAWGRCAEH